MTYTLDRVATFIFVVCISTLVFAQQPAVPADVSKPEAPKPEVSKPDALGVLQGRPDAQGEELLGGNYQNPLAGIAFRVPVNSSQVKAHEGELARFVNEKRGWEVFATRSTSAQPMALSRPDEPGNMGLLEVVAARLKQSSPNIEIVRQDRVNLAEYEVGLIAARISSGTQRRLFQQAIIQADDRLYYFLTMTSPVAKDAKGNDSADPAETSAVEAFTQMLDSVKLLDRGLVKDDQNERLFRTRALLVNLTPKRIRDALIGEQWMRLMVDGKDIGYTYVVEEPSADAGADGIKIGIRARSYPDADIQVDGETWYTLSGDRKHEGWSNLAWLQDLKKKTSDQVTEFGSSDRRIRRVADTTGQIVGGEKNDLKQPPVRNVESYSLNVQTLGKSVSNEQINQELPPWYLPQAVSHLLPRLLPLREPKTYMFAVYVTDHRKVMHRYVDIGAEQMVDLGGKQVRAVPISDRIGLEGQPTIHYMSPEGKYLGSVNKSAKITILPTDAATLQKLWANADLSRPKVQSTTQSTATTKP